MALALVVGLLWVLWGSLFGGRAEEPARSSPSPSASESAYSAPNVFAESTQETTTDGGGVEVSPPHPSPAASDTPQDDEVTESRSPLSPRRKDGRYLPGYEAPSWLAGYAETAELKMPAGASVARGRSLFATSCAPCHGPQGAGDGFSVQLNDTRLRNLARPDEYKYPSDDAGVYRAIAYGFPKTAMYGFRRSLKPLDMWSIAAYVMSLRGR